MRNFIRALCVGVTALVAAAVLAVPAQAQTAQRVINYNSGLCMAVLGGSTAAGAAVVQRPCGNLADHFWRFESLDGNWYRIVNNKSRFCLAVPGESTAWGVELIQWPCGNYNGNYWYRELEPVSGSYRMANAASGLCLWTAGSSLLANARMVQWPCSYFDGGNYWWVT